MLQKCHDDVVLTTLALNAEDSWYKPDKVPKTS